MSIVEMIPHGEKNPQQWVQRRIKTFCEQYKVQVLELEYTGMFSRADGKPDGFRVLHKPLGREGVASYG